MIDSLDALNIIDNSVWPMIYEIEKDRRNRFEEKYGTR